MARIEIRFLNYKIYSLFGILLAIVSVATEPFSAGETYMIWSLAGGVCGIAGLAMVFAKEEQ